MQARVGEEESKARQAESKIETQGRELEELKLKWQRQDEANTRRRILWEYILLLILVVGVACGAAWWVSEQAVAFSKLIGLTDTRLLVGIITFVLSHLCLEGWANFRPPMKELWAIQAD